MRIKNDGVPFQTDHTSSNRLGLRIMNYRAHLVGGEFNIRAVGNSATLVTCVVPCPAESNSNSNHELLQQGIRGRKPAPARVAAPEALRL
jgi:signal transduction histidine kinase